MLRKTRRSVGRARPARIALVASQYNQKYVDGLLAGALRVLQEAGMMEPEVIRVPGAFEIPVAVAHLLRRRRDLRPEAILCLGVIWQGETRHADHIGEAITEALMRLQVDSGVPCIHEVLAVKNVVQAKARCLSTRTNRGEEAAQTGLAMVELLRKVSG